MLIDDSETDNFVNKKMIEFTGVSKNILVINSGKAALDYLKSNNGKTSNIPDLIFLDINMPVVNGFDFLEEYNFFPESIKSKCKIVVLSSSDIHDEIEKMLSNEYVTHYITKPLSKRSIEQLQEVFA